MNTKFYTLEEDQVFNIRKLFARANDNEYFVLNSFKNLSDIVQYSSKYQNVHIITVPTDKLLPSQELK